MSRSDRSGLTWAVRGVAALSVLMASACVSEPGGDREVDQALPDPPAGAIKVEDDLYMVEIGADDRGCVQYSAWSATRGVFTVVYYREESGEFTTDRSKAPCSTR